MERKTLNQILAENLKRRMGDMKQAALSERSGVGQTTISLYLSPGRRKDSTTGRVPSAKLAEIERLARALGCDPLALLTDQDAHPIPFDLIDELYLVEDAARSRIEDMLRGALAAAPKKPGQQSAIA